MLPTGVEFTMDTLLNEDSTTRSCLYWKESTQGLSPVASESAEAEFQGFTSDIIGEDSESQNTP